MSKKIVLVTGGNNGIGLETVAQLAEQPDTHVIMASRSLDKGNAAIETVKARAPNGSVELVQLDITSDDSIEAAVKLVTEKHGHLDTLINNAGICPTEVSRDLFRQTLETNATSPALNTRAFLPLLRKSQSPRVAYVSSRLGSKAEVEKRGELYKIYSVSKAALNMVVVTDSLEYKKDGVKVFAYCPGFVTTDLADMRKQKEGWNLPGPEMSAKGLVAVHNGERDEDAGKFINSGVPSRGQGVPKYYAW